MASATPWHWMAPRQIEVVRGTGSHGGGDTLLLQHLFSGEKIDDPLGRAADFRDGAASIAVGIAGNLSLRTGLPVRVDDLFHF